MLLIKYQYASLESIIYKYQTNYKLVKSQIKVYNIFNIKNMHRAIPGVGNKTLQKKWTEANQQLNQSKLKKIKSRVDLAVPTTFGITKKGSKRDQLVEGM